MFFVCVDLGETDIYIVYYNMSKKETIAESTNALINNIQNDTFKLAREFGNMALIVALSILVWYFYAIVHALPVETATTNSGSIFTWLTLSWIYLGTWVLPITWATGITIL